MQARAKAVADGKSPVAGVHRHRDGWQVKTLQRWGVKQSHLGSFKSREEADFVADTYSPRLEAAASAGNRSFKEELAAVRAVLRVQVRWWIAPSIPLRQAS